MASVPRRRRARALSIFFLVVASTFVPSAHQVAQAAPDARYGTIALGARPAVRTGVRTAVRTVELPWRANMIGVSWSSSDPSGHGVTVKARTLGEDGWSAWFELHVAEDEAPDAGREHARASDRVFTEPRWVGTVRDVEVRLRTSSDASRVHDAALELVNTLGDAEEVPIITRTARAIGRFLTAQRVQPAQAWTRWPPIISRAGWGADESWVNDPPGHASRLDVAIVHHTTGSNSYSRAEAPAMIRGIYSYHVHGRGYGDIAYNFLIDRFGRIYEGRAGGITAAQIGAHAGGFNTYSTGIALLGEFTSRAPGRKMVDALVNLLAWKLDVHHVPPTGTVTMVAQSTASRYDQGDRVRLNRIAAHRHTNATACPGTGMMNRLKRVRERVAARGHPKIYLPSLSAPSIRPNAAGVDATVTLTASFSREVNWSWQVLDADGTPLYRARGTGRGVSRTWGGVGFGGVVLAPGRYAWRLDAARPGGRSARPAFGVIDVLAPQPRGCGGCFVSAPAADFNGDGASDLAIGVPGKDADGVVDSGAVNVLYGVAGEGLSATGDDLVTATWLGLEPSAGDALGSALAAGDFNGDSFDDLAIGIPRADASGRPNAGAVVVVRGSPGGLDPASAVVLDQDTDGVDGAPEARDGFGSSLAAGNVTGDSFADLVVGAPGEAIGSKRYAGMVTMLHGSAVGLVAVGQNGWWQDRAGIGGASERGDRFGASLAIGDVNGDERGDIVIGAPGEAIGSVARAGAVHVIYGDDLGPVAAGSQAWHQSAVGTGASETGDALGFAVLAADVNGDSYAEVIAGVPGQDLGSAEEAGAVVVLGGSEDGLVPASAQYLHRGLVDLGSDPATGDGFGSSLTGGGFNADAIADVAIGIPGDDVGSVVDAGSVMVLSGSSGGLLTVGAHWHLDSGGIIGAARRGDLFGWGLGSGDFDADGHDDLVVGIPGRDLDAAPDAGSVRVLYGSTGGVSSRDQRWDQGARGVRGRPAPSDLFGAL